MIHIERLNPITFLVEQFIVNLLIFLSGIVQMTIWVLSLAFGRLTLGVTRASHLPPGFLPHGAPWRIPSGCGN